MLLRPFLNDASSCASYLFGCGTERRLAVVDPHADLVDAYLSTADALGSPIVAVFETHVQADHVSGLPRLLERAGATAYLPSGAGVEFAHTALADGARVALGNTIVTARPGRSHLLGSALFGIGWAISDACPGPIAAQLGGGRLLALAVGAGVVAGVQLQPRLAQRFHHPRRPRNERTLAMVPSADVL